MLKQVFWILLATALALPAQEKPAQAPPPPPPEPRATYHLEFTIVELESGTKKEARSYSVLAAEGNLSRLRIQNRVPVPTPGATGDQLSYYDLGVNIEALPRSINPNTLRLSVKLEMSALSLGGSQGARAPVVRSLSNQVESTIALDKSVSLTSQDEPVSHSTFQFQVVARLAK